MSVGSSMPYSGRAAGRTKCFSTSRLEPGQRGLGRMATAMHAEHSLTCAEIWQTLRISRATFYRYVALGK